MARTRLSAGEGVRVEFDGLRDLRKDLGNLDKALAKEMRLVLKEATEMVAKEARRRAPRRTGALAASIKAGTSGTRALIRSNSPYFPVHEFGGTTGRGHQPRRGGGSVTIKRSEMVYGAIAAKSSEAERLVLKGIDKLGKRAGFH